MAPVEKSKVDGRGAHLKKENRKAPVEETRGAHLKKGVYTGKPRGRKLGSTLKGWWLEWFNGNNLVVYYVWMQEYEHLKHY